MPVFRSGVVADAARRLRSLVGLGETSAREVGPREDGGRREERRRRAEKRADRDQMHAKRAELRRARDRVTPSASREEKVDAKKEKKRIQQELFRLRSEARAAKDGVEEPVTGALPDFAVIGAMKGGTTWLYHLLTQHPHVQGAAAKELHYFDVVCEDEDVDFYRGCFPKPRSVEGRMTITGEATPYLSHVLAPERMARVVPEARLVCVLRNPVDRAYSHYQQMARKGREDQTFERAVELEREGASARGVEDPDGVFDASKGYLYKGLYADQLPRWERHFGRERMLVLRSEDFFADPPATLATVFDFLGLSRVEIEEARRREPDRRRNEGGYRGGMDPGVRRHLEEYFAPHNRRLYDHLGRDLGW